MLRLYKRCLGLILVSVSGILTLALFQTWTNGSSSRVDVQPILENPLISVFEAKIKDGIRDHQHIAFEIKQDVARCVIIVWYGYNVARARCHF